MSIADRLNLNIVELQTKVGLHRTEKLISFLLKSAESNDLSTIIDIIEFSRIQTQDSFNMSVVSQVLLLSLRKHLGITLNQLLKKRSEAITLSKHIVIHIFTKEYKMPPSFSANYLGISTALVYKYRRNLNSLNEKIPYERKLITCINLVKDDLDNFKNKKTE